MSAPDLTFRLLDGAQAAAHASELQALHAEVCADDAVPRSPTVSWFSAGSRGSSWLRPATAATWWATRSECRCARRPPGGGT